MHSTFKCNQNMIKIIFLISLFGKWRLSEDDWEIYIRLVTVKVLGFGDYFTILD